MNLSRKQLSFLSLTLTVIISAALYFMLAPKTVAFDREQWMNGYNREITFPVYGIAFWSL